MADSPTNQPVVWNGMTMPYGNRTALQWAFLVGQRLDRLGFHGGARLVLQSLALHSDLEGSNRCFPGLDLIAEETGLHKSHVSDLIHELEAAGVVAVKRTGRNNQYQVQLETVGHVWSERTAHVTVKRAKKRDRSSDTNSEFASDEIRIRLTRNQNSHYTNSEFASDDPKKNTEEEHSEEEQGKGTLTTAAAARVAEPSVPVGQDKKTPAPFVAQTVSAAAYFPPIPTPKQKTLKPIAPARPTPEQEAAQHLFELLGEPARHKAAAKNSWPTDLKPIFATRDLGTIKLGMTWAVLESDFWLQWLEKVSNPAAYAVEKFEAWMTRRADDAEAASRKTKKPQHTAAASTPTTKPHVPAWNEI